MTEFDEGPHETDETDEPQLPEALLRALRAPGTPEELAGEQEVLAAFRTAHPAAKPRLRLVGRLGAGGVAAVAALALGTGVAAAAYTNSLPDPVQRLAHRVLAPIGVPAAAPQVHRPSPALPTTRPVSSGPSSPRSSSPRPSSRPSPTPASRPTAAPTVVQPSVSPSATTSPSGPSAGASGSASTTQHPTATSGPLPATVSLALSAAQVAAGSSVLATGTALDATGTPVAKQRILLQTATATTGWRTIVAASTDAHGTVAILSPAITQNTRFRLKLTNPALPRPLLSTAVRVTEAPALVVTYSQGLLQISVVGAQTGDTLKIGVLHDGVVSAIGTAQLIGTGTTYPVQQATTRQRYVVVLARTPQHLGARGAVTVPPPGR